MTNQAMLEIARGRRYTEGPGVAGRIGSSFADYLFSGTLFGGNEGFVSLVERYAGTRVDRVWIGVNRAGFVLRTERGDVYAFQCAG